MGYKVNGLERKMQLQRMSKEKAQRLGCEPSFKRDADATAQVVDRDKETSENAVGSRSGFGKNPQYLTQHTSTGSELGGWGRGCIYIFFFPLLFFPPTVIKLIHTMFLDCISHHIP